MTDRPGPDAIPATYARQAAHWHRTRPTAMTEARWLSRLTEGCPPGAAILDLGCGSGRPIAAHLLDRGFAVTGLDVAAPMIAIARRTLPAGTWIVGDMRAADLGRRFAGIVAWVSFFHLAPQDQRAMFTVFAAHLPEGGRVLLTSGPDAGEVWGRVGDEPVYHASLSPGDMRAVMADAGLAARAFVPEDPEVGGRSVWLAERVE